MSHEIESDTRFYSYREPAWHGLGYVSETAMSIDEALIAADMDFEWTTSPIHTTVLDADGIETIDIPNKHAVIRTNKRDGERKAFGPVGDRYTVHSAREIFSFADALQGGGAQIETLGSLGRGEREFVTMLLPSTIQVGGKDKTNLYLSCTTAFDGTQSTHFDLTPVRVVCANTWRAAKASSQAVVKFRHTSGLDTSDVAKARAILNIAEMYTQELTDLGNKLLGTSMRDEDVVSVLKELFPFPTGVTAGMSVDLMTTGQKRSVTTAQNQRAQVLSLYLNSPARAEADTAWGLFNAVTEWADWYSPVKGEDKQAARAERILLGETESIKDRALSLLLV